MRLLQDLLHDARYPFTEPFVKAHPPLEERKYHPNGDLCACGARKEGVIIIYSISQ